MSAKEMFMSGVPTWNAMCNCKEHKAQGMKRIPKAEVWAIAMELGIDVFTESGAKAVNKALLHKVGA